MHPVANSSQAVLILFFDSTEKVLAALFLFLVTGVLVFLRFLVVFPVLGFRGFLVVLGVFRLLGLLRVFAFLRCPWCPSYPSLCSFSLLGVGLALMAVTISFRQTRSCARSSSRQANARRTLSPSASRSASILWKRSLIPLSSGVFPAWTRLSKSTQSAMLEGTCEGVCATRLCRLNTVHTGDLERVGRAARRLVPVLPGFGSSITASC